MPYGYTECPHCHKTVPNRSLKKHIAQDCTTFKAPSRRVPDDETLPEKDEGVGSIPPEKDEGIGSIPSEMDKKIGSMPPEKERHDYGVQNRLRDMAGSTSQAPSPRQPGSKVMHSPMPMPTIDQIKSRSTKVKENNKDPYRIADRFIKNCIGDGVLVLDIKRLLDEGRAELNLRPDHIEIKVYLARFRKRFEVND